MPKVNKRVTMSFAASLAYCPENPERTAKRNGTGTNFDVTFQEWPNRGALVRTIRMQERGMNKSGHWRAVVPLRETEGY